GVLAEDGLPLGGEDGEAADLEAIAAPAHEGEEAARPHLREIARREPAARQRSRALRALVAAEHARPADLERARGAPRERLALLVPDAYLETRQRERDRGHLHRAHRRPRAEPDPGPPPQPHHAAHVDRRRPAAAPPPFATAAPAAPYRWKRRARSGGITSAALAQSWMLERSWCAAPSASRSAYIVGTPTNTLGRSASIRRRMARASKRSWWRT